MRSKSSAESTSTSDPTNSSNAIKVIKRVLPYLWPEGNNKIRLRVVLSLSVLVLAKLIAVASPFFYKAAVDSLDGQVASETWLLALGASGLVIAYGMTKLMNVLFAQLRDVIFVDVGQGALRTVAFETLSHIHQLSMRYHISRKTGGLNRVVERGIKGIDFLLRFLLFNIGPLLLELILICIILVSIFDYWYLLIVSVTVVCYVWFTTVVTQWRLKIRKKMNDQDRDANQKAVDSLLNFETVKYFNAQTLEAQRYDESMAGYEQAAIKTVKSLALLNVGQSLIINAGLVAALILAAKDVALGQMSIGGFVMVNAYMMQVMMPLGFLGFVYREIRQAIIDMAEMFDLLEQAPEVADKVGAKALVVSAAKIELRNLSFSYQVERPILKALDLVVQGGQRVAIVGASGSGKSTIGRLLFRFYDVNGGQLLIDGQDVRDVTQDSLQRHIGVVPQDTVLFNDSIFYNIHYGNPSATQEEVEVAAKAANVHEFIKELPEGYATKVGERGLKLSGGEKQRVGIARTILKDAPILLLDEATSALDTQTERQIQMSLQKMSANKTVVTIAHRLSTVVDADLIIVLERGEILERGTHQTLLNAGGRYARMWQAQLDGDVVSLDLK